MTKRHMLIPLLILLLTLATTSCSTETTKVVVREIVYDSIGDSDALSRLHKRISVWMRERYLGDIREVAELARHAELAHDEEWSGRLYLQLGDVCRECGCAGMARECYTRALANVVSAKDREVLERRLVSLKQLSAK